MYVVLVYALAEAHEQTVGRRDLACWVRVTGGEVWIVSAITIGVTAANRELRHRKMQAGSKVQTRFCALV